MHVSRWMPLISIYSNENVSKRFFNAWINYFSCSWVKAKLMFKGFSGKISTTLLPHSIMEYVGNVDKRVECSSSAVLCSWKTCKSVMISKLWLDCPSNCCRKSRLEIQQSIKFSSQFSLRFIAWAIAKTGWVHFESAPLLQPNLYFLISRGVKQGDKN